jgi:hypothetical protein
MPRLLHIITKPDDSLPKDLAGRQREAGNEVEVVDLTVSEPDYKGLLKKVFEADSVQCW